MIDHWIADLDADDATTRYDAAQKLGASADPRAVAPLLTRVDDADQKVRYAVFSGLIKLGDRAAALPLLTSLHADRESRVWALMTLNIGLRLRMGLLGLIERGDAAITEVILAALAEDGWGDAQRAFFLRALGRTGTLDQVEYLIAQLAVESLDLRVAAADALGILGDERAVPPLLIALTDRTNELRETAAEALGRLKASQAFDALIIRLDDPNEWVRRATAEALGELGDRAAIPKLSEALRDEEPMVQDAAFDALKKLSYGSFKTEVKGRG